MEELSKLKSAVDQIEETKNSAKIIQESANNIVRGTIELLTTGKTILERVDEVRFKERFDAVEILGMESVELLTTGKTILERVDEVRFKERFDTVEILGMESVENDKTILNRIDKLKKCNSRLSIGVISLLVFQIATLVFLFLK